MPVPAIIAGAIGVGARLIPVALRYGRPAVGLLARGGKWALGGIRGLLGKKMTVGTVAATAAAPTVLSSLDNATGNKASKYLVENTPVAPLLEGALKLNTWANDQPAKVVQSLIEDKLHEKGRIDKDGEEYKNSDYQTLVESLTHFATGDPTGAVLTLGKIKDVELKEADLVESYRKIEEENPDADMAEKCSLIVHDIHEKIQERRKTLENSAEQAQLDTLGNGAPDLNKPLSSRAATQETVKDVQRTLNINMFSKKGLTAIFDEATDKMGFLGIICKAAAGLVGFFNEKAGNSLKAAMASSVLSSLDAQEKYEVMKDVASRGNLVSANANAFGIQGILDSGLQYVPS